MRTHGEAGEPDEADARRQATEGFRAHEMATLLAERSYEAGLKGLLRGLGAAREAARASLRRAAEAGRPAEPLAQRLHRLDATARYVKALAGLMPRRATTQEAARASCHFLETFGPVDATEAAEEARTLDEAARVVLWKRLNRLAGLALPYAAARTRMTALFRRWLAGQYVQAERPRPGRLHVVPLEGAGYDDRPHLYVVGLDDAALAESPERPGLLAEADRAALVAGDAEAAAAAPEAAPAPEAASAGATQWHAEQALRRHGRPASFYACVYDVEAGEAKAPSALFLELERAQEAAAPASLIPPPEAFPLYDQDVWLATYRAEHATTTTEDGPTGDGRNGRRTGDGATGDDAMGDGAADDRPGRARLRAACPWLFDGEAARRARASDVYTAYDGLLTPGPYPDLDLLGPAAASLSASRLECLAETPYIYFLKYVLGVRPLSEPALDDEPWLSPLRKGSVLHRIYDRFTTARMDAAPTLDDAAFLRQIVDEVLAEEVERFAPPAPFVEAEARAELQRHATIFLKTEVEHAATYAPEGTEVGFGFPPARRHPGDFDAPAVLPLEAGPLRLRGRLDRLDRHRDTGTLAVWDFKTGSASPYDDPDDPLQGGKALQWALYAYAVEALTGEAVEASGYAFAHAGELGRRLTFDPAAHRPAAEAVLGALADLARTGSFPMTPDLAKARGWKWGGYDRLVHDLRARGRELKAKHYPDDRPKPPSF